MLELWTLRRLGVLIGRLYGVKFGLTNVGLLLNTGRGKPRSAMRSGVWFCRPEGAGARHKMALVLKIKETVMQNFWTFPARCAQVAALAFALCPPAHARVTRILIDETIPMAAPAGSPDAGIAYEQVAGRAFGELNPKLAGNAIIQDIKLARDADGEVRYVASFVIYKPVDLSKASGLMWHDVPNRARVFAFAPQESA